MKNKVLDFAWNYLSFFLILVKWVKNTNGCKILHQNILTSLPRTTTTTVLDIGTNVYRKFTQIIITDVSGFVLKEVETGKPFVGWDLD